MHQLKNDFTTISVKKLIKLVQKYVQIQQTSFLWGLQSNNSTDAKEIIPDHKVRNILTLGGRRFGR